MNSGTVTVVKFVAITSVFVCPTAVSPISPTSPTSPVSVNPCDSCLDFMICDLGKRTAAGAPPQKGLHSRRKGSRTAVQDLQHRPGALRSGHIYFSLLLEAADS